MASLAALLATPAAVLIVVKRIQAFTFAANLGKLALHPAAATIEQVSLQVHAKIPAAGRAGTSWEFAQVSVLLARQGTSPSVPTQHATSFVGE